MSIGALALSQGPVSDQSGTIPTEKPHPPRKRTVVATADVVAQPEPR